MAGKRRRCDACKNHVAKTWFARHVASGCTVASGLKLVTPLFWLDSSLRLHRFDTLARNGSYYGVRTLRPRKSRRWERVTEGMM